MQRLILRNFQWPGDGVMLTAAVRDLHRTYPGRFLTDVRTSYGALWEHNPYLVPLLELDPRARVVDCGYPLIHRSNRNPHHFLHGFIHDLNIKLGLEIRPTEFRGDIHLSREERESPPPGVELTGGDATYWIIAAGGKFDFTIKWWDPERYQQVVRQLAGRVRFVQVGRLEHFHPRLEGTIDLRGKTDLRQLIQLVHHASGVITPVSLLMHLASAVPTRSGQPRPCVVLAGGREPPHWEAYPTHRYLHAAGQLPCCASGGCWRSRTLPLGDGDPRDQPNQLCVDVVGSLPHCMHRIAAEDVVGAVEEFLDGGRGGRSPEPSGPRRSAAVIEPAEDAFLASVEPYPGRCVGRGVVVGALGGPESAHAGECLRALRSVGCRLPLQLWHLGAAGTREWRREWESLEVECVDARDFLGLHPAQIRDAGTLNAYAVLHTQFREVLMVPPVLRALRDPELLFDSREFRQTGAILGSHGSDPSGGHTPTTPEGAPGRHPREPRHGPWLVDKQRCWRSLSLTLWGHQNPAHFVGETDEPGDLIHRAFRQTRESCLTAASPGGGSDESRSADPPGDGGWWRFRVG